MGYDSIRIDERLILRPPRMEDAQPIRDLIARDSEYLDRYMPWAESVPSLEEQNRFLTLRIERLGPGRRSEWYAIEFDGELVGGIELVIPDATTDRGEIGYWLASHAQGNGIMTRAVLKLTERALKELQLAAIWIYAELDNRPSRSVAERAGFVLNGEYSRKLRLRTHPVIMAGYSASAGEWESAN